MNIICLTTEQAINLINIGFAFLFGLLFMPTVRFAKKLKKEIINN